LIALHPGIVVESAIARIQLRAQRELPVLNLGDRDNTYIAGKPIEFIGRYDKGGAFFVKIEKTHIPSSGIPP
jgi:hypothetical protein